MPILLPSQSPEPKSACMWSSRPIDATIASEPAATGSESTRWFHGLEAGKTGQAGACGSGAAEEPAASAAVTTASRSRELRTRGVSAARRPDATLERGGARSVSVPRVKIRAAVLEEFGQPLVVQEVDLDEPMAREALVRLVACGVCHTDLYTASGADPSGYAPCVLGHEGAGVVEKVGEGVSSLASGDHVVTLFAPECGESIHCRSPRTTRCVAIRDQQGLGYLPDGTTRLSRG